MELISEEFNVIIDDISYTTCKKPNDIITSHWVIPKLSTDFETLKKVFNQYKYKDFKKMVETSVYKDSWFRLPYQTSEEKEKIHKIKQGRTADFFIHNISENAQPFVTDNQHQMLNQLLHKFLKLQTLVRLKEWH